MGYESAAIADFLFHQYKVNRMVVLYTTDIYGEDAVNVFNWRSSFYGFNIIEMIPLSPSAVSTNETQAHLMRKVRVRSTVCACLPTDLDDLYFVNPTLSVSDNSAPCLPLCRLPAQKHSTRTFG